MPDCWLEVSVCIREFLRPAISTQVLVVFLCLQINAEMVPKFRLLLRARHAALPMWTIKPKLLQYKGH
jgi:hypothetical protein